MKTLRYFLIVCTLLLGLTLTGCSPYYAKSSSSVPLSTVINPVNDSRQVQEKSQLNFPASMAIIYVPSNDRGVSKTALREAAASLKQQLLANPKYVRSVSMVTLDDINAKIDLAQVRTLYDAEIAIIISYEQDQTSQQSGPGALADATIIGAFAAPTVKTETSSHVEGRVVHIASNALILRKSGTDKRDKLSTSYGRESTLANESIASVQAATTDFGNAVTETLSKFDNFDLTKAVAMSISPNDSSATNAANDNWHKVDSFKYSGGGSVDYVSFLLILLFTLTHVVLRARHRLTKQG